MPPDDAPDAPRPPSGVRKRPDQDSGAALIGQTIDGRYRLAAPLGRGGMGVVYRAAHVGLRRDVAIKILHPSLAASPEIRSRFEREALAIGKIDHPNCVGVYDVGRLPDDSLYLVMELLEGQSLADLLADEGQLPAWRALRILSHILRGLGHIHASGLIHRDLKPENIYLVHEGEDLDFAKILDFGIAKPMEASDLDDGVKLTQAGMAFGTPIYMAPEQALGNPLDGRADLYAAAVLAYEMLTGNPPFFSEDKLEVMSAHTTRPVPPMREKLVDPDAPVPVAIEQLIRRGLAKRANDRPNTAEAFLAEIEQLRAQLAAGTLGAPPPASGAQSLLSASGQVSILDANDSIRQAIDDSLAAAHGPLAVDLDPTVRAPQVRRRWPLYLFVASAAITLGVVIALATLPRGGAGQPTDPAGPVAVARGALAHGDPQAAISVLEANQAKLGKDPEAQLLLGHAHAARREAAPALEAYRQALTLSPTLGDDQALRANLKSIAADKDGAQVAEALELWCRKTADPDCGRALIAAAASDSLDQRRAARTVIDRYHLRDGVDWLAAYSLDLEQEPSCERRREAVGALRALGDPRAIPALERAIARKAKPGPKAKPASPCLVDDATAAIAYLHDRAPATAPAPAGP